MYTDTCYIQSRTETISKGRTSKGDPVEVRCRREDNTDVVGDSQGNSVVPRYLYILPPGTVVSRGDLIKGKTICGREVSSSEEYQRIVRSELLGRMYPHHYEVYT